MHEEVSDKISRGALGEVEGEKKKRNTDGIFLQSNLYVIR